MKNLFKYLLISIVFAIFFGTVNAFSQSENAKISNLIEQKKSFNKNNKSSVVYKIQLYNGIENQAFKIKREFEQSFPEYKTLIVYKEPEWKTQVGIFKNRLEADRALLVIQQKYAGAIVLEDKI